MGAAASRNDGLARVDTDWVAFCDDDDVWSPSKLRQQLRALEQTPSARWASCGVVFVDDRLRVIGYHRSGGGDVVARLAVDNLVPSGSTVLAATELLLDIGGFDPSLRCCEDWDCWIRLAERSPLAVADAPLVA